MNVFDEMGIYWAEIADQNQTEKQIQFLKKHVTTNSYVLDVACGTGRHIIPLSQMGYCIVGIDVSISLLKIAKKRFNQIELVRGDMRFLPFKTAGFSATISMDTSFGYLPSKQDDKTALAEIKRTLIPPGIFIVDVFNRQELALKYKDKNNPPKWREYPSFYLQQKRTMNPKGDWLHDLWTIQDKASGHLLTFEHAVRLYGQTELEGLLIDSGFAVLEVYGGYAEENLSKNSTRLILIAETK